MALPRDADSSADENALVPAEPPGRHCAAEPHNETLINLSTLPQLPRLRPHDDGAVGMSNGTQPLCLRHVIVLNLLDR